MALESVVNDLDDARHLRLDKIVIDNCLEPSDLKIAAFLLLGIAQNSDNKLDPKYKEALDARLIIEKHGELLQMLTEAWRHKSFKQIRNLKILRPPISPVIFLQSFRINNFRRLNKAYNIPFIGNTAYNLVNYLRKTDDSVQGGEIELYAKAISVVQSSGTGKSRLFTQVGQNIFTLPICLRDPADPGYPPSDENVHKYFMAVPNDNDMSFTAHCAIASFLAAAHQIMLKWLKAGLAQGLDKNDLLRWWHNNMEQEGRETDRKIFFDQVLEQAHRIKSTQGQHGASPKRPTNKTDIPFDIVEKSTVIYTEASKAVEALMTFLVELYDSEQLCVTYFDEAHELDSRLWILMRLLSHQTRETKMWYAFMGTKSSISYFTPPPNRLTSLRLDKERRVLLPPYLALDFDQNVPRGEPALHVTIDTLQSIAHSASYGRPMWKAHLPEGSDGEMIRFASTKLTNAALFDEKSIHHVFAVLSQRLCIQPVLVGSEAIALTDRSVAHHMRLLTGVSADRQTFYTFSPSEPVLVLGAHRLMYKPKDDERLGKILNTFSEHLCSAGLVEKGLVGELGARLLILLARDFAASVDSKTGRNLLQLVSLTAVIETLFGWTGKPGNEQLRRTFSKAYVNFTHWVETKEPLPETPNQLLLANLWARGAILQCAFYQESIDFLMVTYHGDIKPDAVFDPAMLSGAFGQVKFKSNPDTQAEKLLRPIGLPRNFFQPLPYLALLLELGTESFHKGTKSKLQVITPKAVSTSNGGFGTLVNNWLTAAQGLANYQAVNKKDPKLVVMKKAVEETQYEMDQYNRYTIVARGASVDVYGILSEANIVKEFAALLKTTLPSPTEENETIQHMRPFERLGDKSGHMAWMTKYAVPESGDEDMDVDR